jgi:ABC-type lipoprotein release transport system permease subunit
MYNAVATDEAVISVFTAQKNHVHVGQVVTIPFGTKAPEDTPIAITIVGTIVAPQTFPPRPTGQGDAFFLSPGFSKAHPGLFSLQNYLYRLRRGPADVDAFKAELDAMAKGKPLGFFIEARVQDRNTEHAIHVQSVALWVLAALIGLAMLAALGQSFSRQMYLEAEEHPALRSIGMSKWQLWGLGMARAEAIGLVGGAIALAVGIGVSWFTPIGIARYAELHKGVVVDWVVLSIGFGAVLLVTAVLAAWPAWRSAGDVAREQESERPSLVAAAAARAGLSPSSVSGIRLALEPGRGRTAVPVRSTVLGVAIGIAAVIMSLGFAMNLSHLLRTPSQYGWNWDSLVTSNNGYLNNGCPGSARPLNGPCHDEIKGVTTAPGVDASALGTTGVDVAVDGKQTTAVIMNPPRGTIGLVPVLTGRNPAAAGEVLVGAKTLKQIHKRIGETVNVRVFGGLAAGGTFRIVGTGVLPLLSDTGGLGTGVVLNISNAHSLIAGPASPDTILVHFTPGPGRAAALTDLKRHFPELDFQSVALPADVANFGGVRDLPFMMAALLAGLALLLMVHTLVSSIKRRSRDLAILKTIGFAGGQLRATVAWQASALTVLSLIIGLPLGVVGARWAWNLFASNLGVVPDTLSPILALGILAPAALAIANLIAAVPGGAASRVQPARVFRAE